MDAILLSRLQFGITAMYHFLFVPLTLGLVFLIAIMESIYLITGKEIWKQMTKFWGALFGINFAMGVATGIPLEFQFGTNWAYYSHYVGDIFGPLLAIEGLMAFFLEATFIGLFFFGWNRLSKGAHLFVTWGMAIGSSFSALWILIANAWMQNPVGAKFNPEKMRMELESFSEVFFNPVAQDKFLHTIYGGYVTGAIFVIAISGYYLLKKQNLDIAKRSINVAAVFGLISAFGIVIMGDSSGYNTGKNQKMKIAAMESLWETEKAPADFLLFALPDQKNQTNNFEIKIPYVLGILLTRSLDQTFPGIKDLVEAAKDNIRKGQSALKALETLKEEPKNSEALETLSANQHIMGYGLLLKKYTDNPINADEEMITKAAEDTIPNVPVLFWAFRLMVGIGFYFILFFIYTCYRSIKNKISYNHKFFYLAIFTLPLPWIASLSGWLVAEYGRQPWAIHGILPTFLGASNITSESVLISLFTFVVFYTGLLIVDIYLMRKYILLGPEKFKTLSQNEQKLDSY